MSQNEVTLALTVRRSLMAIIIKRGHRTMAEVKLRAWCVKGQER